MNNKRIWDFYSMQKDAGIIQTEFGFFCLDEWKSQGHITDSTNLGEIFGYEHIHSHGLGQLGWCEAAFMPAFETKILEDRGEYELVQDFAGRRVLYFKGRRNGFMPEYTAHPVTDMKSWEENCKWRLQYDGEREKILASAVTRAVKCQEDGYFISQGLVGGYMYLRSLMGPEDLLYKFYDDPELIRDCMETWLKLADSVIAFHQKHVIIDELFFAEDICYKSGPLISPDMMREFLFPYYQQLISNLKSRQKGKSRRLYIQIDTDGNSISVIDAYKEIGMDYMSPFEAASGCDVVKVAENYPDLLIRGGIDKRILAAGKEAIDREVDRVMPVMKKRGGYIPTCDHGVPAEVKFEDYLHYRKRMSEFKD